MRTEPHKWTAKELALLGEVPDSKVAKLAGLPVPTVRNKRYKLGIAPAHHLSSRVGNWGATELGMLGRYPDAYLARITGRPVAEIVIKRESLGMAPAKKK
jgi:hypothetical protein